MKKIVVLMLTALMLAGITVTPRVEAARLAQDADGGNKTYLSDFPTQHQSASDVLQYWTEEQKASAQPAPIDRIAAGGPAITQLTQADGTARAVYGYGFSGTETAAFNLAVPGGGSGSPFPNFDYPFAYDYSYLQMSYVNKLIPYSTYGKLYYTNNSTNYVCSGTSVTSGAGGGNQSLVLTAGHCLHSGNNLPAGWSTNLLFVPAKLGASEPFGSWAGSTHLVVRASWYQFGDEREDFGILATDPTSNVCGALAVCVGASGLSWNQNPVQEYWPVGYPAQSPFTGDRPVMCTASFARLDSLVPGPDRLPMGIGCNLNGGSSGGGWVTFGKTANVGFVNSVTAYKYVSPNQPEAIYGPYFASNFESLWNSIRTTVVP